VGGDDVRFDFQRVQDLALIVARWLLLGALLLAFSEDAEGLIPLGLVGGIALYCLFLTIAFVGGWAGTRLFAYFQSLGDLAVLAALLVLAPSLLGRVYVVLLGVAGVIGLRRLPWGATAGFAVLAGLVGLVAERVGFAELPYELAAVVPAAIVLGGRLLAGEPPAAEIERRPPLRAEQTRALLNVSHVLTEPGELQALLAEAHRLTVTQTGATRAAVVVLGDVSGQATSYAFPKGQVQVKPLTLPPEEDGAAAGPKSGAPPHERVLRQGVLRLVRERTPLPVIEIVDGRAASSFLGVPLRARGKTLGALLAYDKDGGKPFTEQDEVFLDLLATAVAAGVQGGRAAISAEESMTLFPRGALAVLTQRRPEAEAHGEQVARFAVAIGQELGMTPAELAELRLGALLHDLGELSVAGDPFNRAQTLSAEEHERIKEHPWHGARLLAELDQPDDVVDMVHQHHERWDGQGYPQGVERAEITPAARVLAVADALDAMTADRPYRAPRPVREAVQELVANSGSQFDPSVVQALMAIVAREGDGWVATQALAPRARVEPWRGRFRRRYGS
jgi:putative nucleotidyltransferase with HDIG domain